MPTPDDRMERYEASPEGVVAWLRSPDWDGDATWEHYARAIADAIERDFGKVAQQPRGAVEENERLREAVRVYLFKNGRVRELCEAFGLKMPGNSTSLGGQ